MREVSMDDDCIKSCAANRNAQMPATNLNSMQRGGSLSNHTGWSRFEAGAVISRLRAIVAVYPNDWVADQLNEADTQVSLADILTAYDALTARLAEVERQNLIPRRRGHGEDVPMNDYQAPMVWFGGKSRIARS